MLAANKELQQSGPAQWDMGLRTMATGAQVTLRITLPDAFPDAAPIATIVERPAVHPWLDAASQRFVGCEELNSWTPFKNLGMVGYAARERKSACI